MMDMQTKNQYLKTLISKKGYYLLPKKEKSKILDEYCQLTGQNRNYVIRKIRSGNYLKSNFGQKRKRDEYYDGQVKVVLKQIWEIFDYPCGQRLEPLLKQGWVERLRNLGEIDCSDEVLKKLKKISAKTIDRKLKRSKEEERIKRKYKKKIHPLLYQKIPVKIFAEQNRKILGNIQVDLVEHCGQSARGKYLNTLSITDIAIGWWEAEAIMGRGQVATQKGLDRARQRFPFSWREIHSDNGTEFINWHLYRYCQQSNLGFSRSRPYHKNDNCLVEQKNWTHIKKYVGYLRYDTDKELEIINSLIKMNLGFTKIFVNQ